LAFPGQKPQKSAVTRKGKEPAILDDVSVGECKRESSIGPNAPMTQPICPCFSPDRALVTLVEVDISRNGDWF
jgi:hypothetical protein